MPCLVKLLPVSLSHSPSPLSSPTLSHTLSHIYSLNPPPPPKKKNPLHILFLKNMLSWYPIPTLSSMTWPYDPHQLTYVPFSALVSLFCTCQRGCCNVYIPKCLHPTSCTVYWLYLLLSVPPYVSTDLGDSGYQADIPEGGTQQGVQHTSKGNFHIKGELRGGEIGGSSLHCCTWYHRFLMIWLCHMIT